MAVATLPAEFAAMDVVGLVTVETIRGQLDPRIASLRMTCIAFRLRMGTVERKFRLLGMIKGGLSPARGRMARTAFVSEATGVDVFARMTSRTGLGQLSLARRFAVTGDASRLRMRATERKAALLGMIEILAAPGSGRVTIGASRPEATGVGVIDRVAVDAFLRRSLVLLRGMTSRTTGLLVTSGQRVLRLVVIEAGRSPIRFFVALATVVAHRVTVSIVFAVAVDTIAGRIAPGDIGSVAILASRGFVPAAKRIVGLAVIEGVFAQAADVPVTSNMVRMTAPTLAIQRQGIPTMKSFIAFEIAGNQLVTIQA